jgi:hypothetical protein
MSKLLLGRPKRTRRRGSAEQVLGVLGNVGKRFGRTTSPRSEGEAYGKAVGLGISALVALMITISLSVWLLRKRAREEETAPLTPEPEEGVEAVPSEEEPAPGPPSAEDVPPREEPPPPGEERRGETPTSPPTPREEEPPPGEERPGRR